MTKLLKNTKNSKVFCSFFKVELKTFKYHRYTYVQNSADDWKAYIMIIVFFMLVGIYYLELVGTLDGFVTIFYWLILSIDFTVIWCTLEVTFIIICRLKFSIKWKPYFINITEGAEFKANACLKISEKKGCFHKNKKKKILNFHVNFTCHH